MTQVNSKNREQLKLLSTFHYVLGGLTAVLSLVSLAHIGLGLWFILTTGEVPTDNVDLFPRMLSVGGLFFVVGLVVLLMGLTFSVCLIMSGRALAKQKRYWFSFVIACLQCLYTPFGTVLGIFTIIVLSRESVKALYRSKQRQP